MRKASIIVILFFSLSPACLFATSIDSINVCSVNAINQGSFSSLDFTIIVKISDPLGVPANIQSVTAVGLSAGDTYNLEYSPYHGGGGDYRNFTWESGLKEYPRYNAQKGLYKITVVNKQGEIIEKLSYYLDTIQPLRYPANLWITNFSNSDSMLGFDLVPYADWYFYQIFDSRKFILYQSNYSSIPYFTLNPGILEPNQIYYIMAAADDYLIADLFGQLQRRSANTMPYSPKNRTFGLFVGTRGEGNYRADLMAEQLGNAFITNVVGTSNKSRVKILKGDSINAEGLRPEDIQKAINEFNLNSGDNLFIYIAGHGGSFTNTAVLSDSFFDETLKTSLPDDPLISIADEYIVTGKAAEPATQNIESYKGYLTDDLLMSYLKPFNKVNKWIFLDACHSGGFWGDLSSTDAGDLAKLKRISLLSSTSENGDGVYDAEGDGLPLFGKALLEGFKMESAAEGNKFKADKNGDGLTFSDLKEWLDSAAVKSLIWGPFINSYVYRAEFAADFWEPVIFTEEMWNPQGFKSADFNGIINESSLTINLAAIDVSPEEYPNPVNLHSNGVVRLAVKTTPTFDARTINIDTIRFADALPISWSLEDTNNDGDLDLAMQFNILHLNLVSNASSATLVARTDDGKGIQGSDEVWIVAFDDVPYEHWAYQHIRGIYNAGITLGCLQDNFDTPENEAEFCPDFSVTREQMAAFITRALNQVPEDGYCGTTNPFSDVSFDRWSCKNIKRFYELGITTGYGDGRFGPDDAVTREQMAVFLTRLLGQVPEDGYCGTTDPFPDVPYGSWSCKYIKRLYELGITTGYNDGRFGLNDDVTRAQMATFLARSFLGM